MLTKFLAIDMVESTAATQVRTKLHKDVIDMYCEDIQNGAIMPPIDVFCEKGSSRHILADGFHRKYAAVNAGKDEIEVNVHEGGMHAALAFALGSNRVHGLRRSNADKINAVQLSLKDPEFSKLTQQEIADLCGVSLSTVSRVSLRETVGENKSKTQVSPETNKAENNRPTKEEPTQAEIELQELRMALAAIKKFPYAGGDALKLSPEKDDIADLEYVSEWCAHAVLAYRNGKSGE